MPYKNLEITTSNYSNQHTVARNHIYKGFSTVDPTNYGGKLFDFDLIKQDIINHFNTRKGERVMNPEFGSIIWDLIYEPLTPVVKQQIAEDIDRILNLDPRVVPTLINIVEQDYGFLLELTLSYQGTDVSDNMILSFDKRVGLAG